VLEDIYCSEEYSGLRQWHLSLRMGMKESFPSSGFVFVDAEGVEIQNEKVPVPDQVYVVPARD